MEFHWTHHARAKMKFYRLSEQRVRGIINSPKRVEQGIAPATTAAMQGVGSKNHPYEIWVMFRKATKNKQQETRIISAWRYPGITKPGEPLPEKILQEISETEKLKD
ncbi:MAG: hypothetical protein UX23_C0001G0056 [Parcubacteria group bacterium GW2011_GWB1_45_9]|nr:MAG: hypothetical protein UX23_C0001G0056 [Parcubacteria group bacterium GW2011_GWB1_45_9]